MLLRWTGQSKRNALPHLPAVYRMARQLVGGGSADDLVEETSLRAWNYFETFDSATNCRAWLFRILRNIWISRWRKSRLEMPLADAGDGQFEPCWPGCFEPTVKPKVPIPSRGNSSDRTMMDCRNVREILDLYIDGELSPEATVQAEAHLAECLACRRAAGRLNRLRQAVKAVVDQYQPSTQLVQHVRRLTLSRWRRAQAWIPAVAAMFLILAVGLSTPQIRGAAANGLAAAFHLDGSRTVVREGKLLGRECQLKEKYGYQAMCPVKGHHGSLQTMGGKIWHILDGQASEELIHNSKLLGRTVRIRGRLFRRADSLERRADSLEVDEYELL